MAQKGFVRGMAWLLAGIFLWIGALGALERRSALFDNSRISYRGDNVALTADDLRALRKAIAENGNGDVAGYAQALSKRLSVAQTEGSVTVDILFVDGNAPLVWNLSVVTGVLPMQKDENGCAIDVETALLLFGSTQVIGRSVLFSDQELIVRGVFSLPSGLSTLAVDPGRGLAICPIAAALDGTYMTALEFTVTGDQSVDGKSQVTDWMRTASVLTSGTLDDHRDQRIMLSELMTFPSYALFIMIVFSLYAATKKLLKKALLTHRMLVKSHVAPNRVFLTLWICTGLTLAFIIAALLSVVAYLLPPIRSIPPSYLPTRWSDFSFWSTLITDALQQKAKHALSVLLRPDMVFGRLTDYCTWLPAASIAAFIHARNVLKRKLLRVPLFSAALAGCAVCAFVPAAGLVVKWIGWIPEIPLYAFWLPVLLYETLVVTCCGNIFEQWRGCVHRLLRIDKISQGT